MDKIQSKETGLSTIPVLLNIVLDALAGLIRQKKGNWRDQHKKSISLSRWHDIIHEKFQKLCVLIYITNKFSNAAGYRIKLKKSITLLCTNNKHINREIMDTVLFVIAWKKIK